VDWTQTFELRSLLLEGTRQGKTAVLTAEGKNLVEFEEELEVSADFLYITVGGAVRPILEATVTAEAIEVGDGSVTSTTDILTVPKPATNDGFTEFDATWKGTLAGKMGLRVAPTVTVQVDRFTFGPLTYPLDIDIFSDTVPLESAPSKVTHDLPAGVAGARTLDFGQVVVGDSVTREFSLKNLGNVELKGTARVEGNGFVMPAEAVLVARTNGGAATTQDFEIDFLPAAVGSFTGTLVFETNDPVNPEIRVPMAGAGVNPPDDDPDGDPNDTDDGDGLISQPGRGCGCDTSSPVGFGFAGLFGLLAVLRRRR
jgi:MYXO-CTERM domain-containing protein